MRTDDGRPIWYDVNLKGATLMPFGKNFSGIGNDNNREGDRNFLVRLDNCESAFISYYDPDTRQPIVKNIDAEWLYQEGWNVKTTNPRTPDDIPEHFVKVNVKYGEDERRHPKVNMVVNGKRTALSEKFIKNLDDSVIVSCNLIVRSSYPKKVSTANDGHEITVSGYLSQGDFVIRQNWIDEGYDEAVPEELPFDQE